MVWQLQEAKQRFSQLVQKAINEGPQVVSRHGEEVVVVLSKAEYDRLRTPAPDFREFLLSFPKGDELDIRRSEDKGRKVEL
jgi:antitoxin Phd